MHARVSPNDAIETGKPRGCSVCVSRLHGQGYEPGARFLVARAGWNKQ